MRWRAFSLCFCGGSLEVAVGGSGGWRALELLDQRLSVLLAGALF